MRPVFVVFADPSTGVIDQALDSETAGELQGNRRLRRGQRCQADATKATYPFCQQRWQMVAKGGFQVATFPRLRVIQVSPLSDQQLITHQIQNLR